MANTSYHWEEMVWLSKKSLKHCLQLAGQSPSEWYMNPTNLLSAYLYLQGYCIAWVDDGWWYFTSAHLESQLWGPVHMYGRTHLLPPEMGISVSSIFFIYKDSWGQTAFFFFFTAPLFVAKKYILTNSCINDLLQQSTCSV